MIDWIRKRIIIEKNAVRRPKKKARWRRAGGGQAVGWTRVGEGRAGEGREEIKAAGGKEKARANYWE